MVETRWWHRLGPPLTALVLALPVGLAPARPAYQGSVYSNYPAFSVCDGTADTIATELRLLARNAFVYLGYATTSFDKAGFSKATVLKRNPADSGVYVHSHGDFYGSGGIPGLRGDGGVCEQVSVLAHAHKRG